MERRDLLTLLGVVASHPLITFDNTGVTTYDATTDQFFSDATPMAFQQAPASPIRPVLNPRDFKIDIRVDDTGAVTGGAPGDDLIVSGSINIDGVGPVDVTGTLLTGEIIAFGYANVDGTDLYDFRFMVTGGALTTYNPAWFAGKDIAVTMVSEISTFNDDFTVNFNGGAKGTLGTIDQIPGSISGTKWLDMTGDGLTVDDVVGLGGWTIDLYADTNNNGLIDDGPAVGSTVTAGDGTYSFSNLTPGNYIVAEVLQVGYVQTAPVAPGYYVVAVTAGGNTTSLDFANAEEGVFEQVGRISGTKWTDITGNGITGDDTLLANVTINLFFDADDNGLNDDGPAVATTMTAGDGTYSFEDLDPGRYFVQEVAPAGYVQTAPGSGSYTVNVASGSDNPGNDFANFQLGSISGTKYKDLTGNGITGDDTGLGGTTINLFFDANDNNVNDDGPAVASTTTAAVTGAYSFGSLGAGRYFVQEVVPAGYTQTAPVPGTYTVVITSGTNETAKDFANFKKGSLSGAKVKDVTGNGLTLDDTGLGGTTIELYFDANDDGIRNDGAAIATTVTAAVTGAYSFVDLGAGRYFVREIVPTGYVRTHPALTDTYIVVIAGGNDVTGLSFANALKRDCACDCDCKDDHHNVCNDTHHNGGNCDCDDGDCRVKNISYIINGTTIVSDLRGNTNQGDLVQVRFTVTAGDPIELTLVSYTAPGPTFVAADAYLQQIFDVDTGFFGPGTYTLEVFNPDSFYQVDFVCGPAIDRFGPAGSNIFYSPQMRLISADNDGCAPVLANGSSLAGSAYVDANNSGARDPSENGIGLVKVRLTGTDDLNQSVTLTRYTKADGSYLFDNLRAGTYTITEFQPSGYLDGLDSAGSLGGTVGNDVTSGIALAAATNGINYEFGEAESGGGAGGGGSDACSVQVDPFDANKAILVVNGTSGNDKITVKKGSNGRYSVWLNYVLCGSFSPIDSEGRSIRRIVVNGNAGDDDIYVDYSVTIEAWLYGGEGNDKLTGGKGNNVLLGGAGNDYLKGNSLRDLIIAGTGSDDVNGMGGEDLLISGTTAFDGNETALRSIFAEWNSSRDYLTRIKNIKNGTGSAIRLNDIYFLNDNTVFDDYKVDYVSGGDGRDWYLVNTDSYRRDVLEDRSYNETVTDIDG